MIVPLVDSEAMFTAAFEQGGYGMPRYRGSPMLGGSFWGRMIGFTKGLFSKAAPHISNLVTKAQPHVKKAASRAIESAIDSAVTNVTDKLKTKAQAGGRRKPAPRKRLKKPKLKGSKIK